MILEVGGAGVDDDDMPASKGSHRPSTLSRLVPFFFPPFCSALPAAVVCLADVLMSLSPLPRWSFGWKEKRTSGGDYDVHFRHGT